MAKKEKEGSKPNPRFHEHWEEHYSTNEPSKYMKAQEGSDFCPKRSSERPTTYVKINETDH